MLETIKSLCEERQKVIVSKDKGSACEHRAINEGENLVAHYQIDGDLFTDKTTLRCDFLVLNEEKKNAYLIELKGTKLLHAIKQLENTADMLKKDLKEYQVYFRIVYHTKTQGVRSSEYIKKKKKWKGRVLAKTNKLEENI